MNEAFFQYLWERKLFRHQGIITDTGEKIIIVHPGKKNTDAGPDFLNARIKIGNTIWAGNVEIHKKSSDWYHHRHHTDPAYSNVILHVVEKNDRQVMRDNGEIIPAIELVYDQKIEGRYRRLLESSSWVACAKELPETDPFIICFWLTALLVERLEEKTGKIRTVLLENRNDWEETFYRILARNFGFRLNSEPFEMLACKTPLKYISRLKYHPLKVEALLLGQAGFLAETYLFEDYYTALKKEYGFLSAKYSLKALPAHTWKFSRSRPANFPTIRLAQFASLLCNADRLFSKIIEMSSIEGLYKLFEVKASAYWNTHYHFDKISHNREKVLGRDSINILLINTVIPFIFLYGQIRDDEYLKERALSFMEQIPPEKNSITAGWETAGVKSSNAADSQALLQLKSNYCNQKKCLNCQIGNKLIANDKN
ncbi:MAG: DUF2851 family protein [Bacteroidota bacterium]